MGMTMTEKILARGAGRDSVAPGEIVLAKIDFAMGHDLTIPPAGKIMREQMGAQKVWDTERVAVVQDHFQPAKDIASAALGRTTREFAHEMGIKWYFEVGQGGIMEHDEITEEYLRGRAKRSYSPVSSDPDAHYERVIEVDAEKVELTVAKPMSPDNTAPLREVAGTRLDQVFIGSCTNSRITDLRKAAAILKGRTVAPGVRLIVTPSSHQVAQQAEREGLIGIFMAAGGAWTTATCGACLGGHMGVVGEVEVCLL